MVSVVTRGRVSWLPLCSSWRFPQCHFSGFQASKRQHGDPTGMSHQQETDTIEDRFLLSLWRYVNQNHN